jgi:hypothetical protein
MVFSHCSNCRVCVVFDPSAHLYLLLRRLQVTVQQFLLYNDLFAITLEPK